MVASGVLPVGAMRPRLSASSVTSRVVRGRLADFRTASAAARKVIGSDGKGATMGRSQQGPVPGSAARITWIRPAGQLGPPQARHPRRAPATCGGCDPSVRRLAHRSAPRPSRRAGRGCWLMSRTLRFASSARLLSGWSGPAPGGVRERGVERLRHERQIAEPVDVGLAVQRSLLQDPRRPAAASAPPTTAEGHVRSTDRPGERWPLSLRDREHPARTLPGASAREAGRRSRTGRPLRAARGCRRPTATPRWLPAMSAARGRLPRPRMRGHP